MSAVERRGTRNGRVTGSFVIMDVGIDLQALPVSNGSRRRAAVVRASRHRIGGGDPPGKSIVGSAESYPAVATASSPTKRWASSTNSAEPM